VPWYALFYLLAIAGGCGAIYAEGRRRRFDADRWTICVAAWAIGGIAGAVAPQFFLGELAATRTAVGAVAGATIALFICAALFRIPADRALDTTAVAIPLGGALARLGCFIADCCEGLATSLPVGIIGEDGIRRHPTQLYEAAFDTVVAIALAR
jgi:prolipoprotein diacylglyceryltransferase